MTDQERRIATAEACGYKPNGAGYWRLGNQVFALPVETLPDYLDDQNAMHTAEMMLTDTEYGEWCWALHRLRNDVCMPVCRCHSAPTRQRNEAFLRVKGLWKD